MTFLLDVFQFFFVGIVFAILFLALAPLSLAILVLGGVLGVLFLIFWLPVVGIVLLFFTALAVGMFLWWMWIEVRAYGSTYRRKE